MPSGIMGKLAATNITAMIDKGDAVQVRAGSMADMAQPVWPRPDPACATGARPR